MATAEIKQRVALESERRARLAVPALAGGFLYLLSAIILNATLKELPTVGIVQGLEPALRGEANPAASPRAAEVRFIDHHAFGLISGSVLTAIAVLALMLVLVFLAECTRFRRPEAWPPARVLVIGGAIGYAALNLIHEVLLAVEAHKFTHGSDFSNKAVEKALLGSGGVGVTLGLLGLIAALALAVGMVAITVGAMRAGLLVRWMGMVGAVSGVLFLPFFGGGSSLVFDLIPAFWMVAAGILLIGRWPNGDPPAWLAGESRPWPTQAEMRAERQGKAGGTPAAAAATQGGAAGELAPPPTPAAGGSRRKRRKR